jgi:hypothetical protein
MAVDDRLINVRVGQAFVRRGIDTQKVQVSTHHGVVMVQGRLEPMSKRYEIKGASDMKALEQQLRRIPNVKDVRWQLENWRREEGAWKRTKAAGGPAGPATTG